MNNNAQSFLNKFLGENHYKLDKKIPESKNVVRHDQWDREDYEGILEEMKELSVAEDRLTDVVDTGSAAMADEFFSLVKANPKMKELDDVRPSYIVNHSVMEEAMKLKEYEELRTYSTSDVVSSGLACIAMEPELEILFDKVKEQSKMAQQLEEQLQAMQGMSDDLSDAEEMAAAAAAQGNDGEAQDYQKQAEKIKEQMDKLREQMQQKAQEIDDGMQKKVPELKEAGRAAMKKAKEKAEELDSLSNTWGLDPGTLSKMPAKRRIELAGKFNNEKFRRIAELIGPMTRLALAEQMRKVNYARDEIYDLEQGNDLANVLPTEMILMDDPDMGVVFLKKYMEHELLQYKLRGNEKVAKGGIIWVEDGSGSMYGDPEVWAKAVGGALYQIAKLQKREFYAIHFGSPGEYMSFDFHDDVNIGVDIELYGKPYKVSQDDTGHYENLDGLIKFMETFFGGGTDFVTPLSAALDKLREQHDKFGGVKGDIVFCTDGICGVPEEWLKEFKEEQERLGFKVWGILLGYAPHKDTEPLNTICDGRVFLLSELLSGDGVRGIFGGV
jgi:uncharacterized protein with von Willebrand factor type A (vWA) domain